MTKRTGQKIERKAVAAYRATPATQALIKRAAAIASVKPSVYVGRVAEERARQDVAGRDAGSTSYVDGEGGS
jgi:uncharacterized protein (DUF1778 family)